MSIASDEIKVIRFEIELHDGQKVVAEFHRTAKIEEILGAEDPLGEFLADLLMGFEER